MNWIGSVGVPGASQFEAHPTLRRVQQSDAGPARDDALHQVQIRQVVFDVEQRAMRPKALVKRDLPFRVGNSDIGFDAYR